MADTENIANREEADKCKEIAKHALHKGDYAKAVKFFEKSLRLYPLPGVAELKAKAEKLMETGGKPAAASSTRTNQSDASAPSPGPGTSQRGYTPEQETGAKKILQLAKKSHYEVLGIPKDADENTIKKAYKKLALKYHPDKNSAPSAEAAFKSISTAFDTLNDTQKREIYDQVGHDAATSNGGMDGGGHPFANAFRYGGRAGGVHMQQVDPEELFNMFFQGMAGGPGVHFRTNFNRTRAQQQQHQYDDDRRRPPQSMLTQLLQFAPIIILLLMSLGSWGGKQPVYSFSSQGSYNIERTTNRGVPYYVPSSFDNKYPARSYYLNKIEKEIDLQYRDLLGEECYRERSRKNTAINRASWSSNPNDKVRAQSMPTPYCDELNELFGTPTSSSSSRQKSSSNTLNEEF